LKLSPLYTVRFSYPEDWGVEIKASGSGKESPAEEEHFAFAHGRVEGKITGEFHGANHPHRRMDKTFAMNLQGYIKTEDGTLIMTDYRGYGRSSVLTNSKHRFRQVVGAAYHVTDGEKYRWLNDSVCAIVGEVRRPLDIPYEKVKQSDVMLVFDVAELIWEPTTE